MIVAQIEFFTPDSLDSSKTVVRIEDGDERFLLLVWRWSRLEASEMGALERALLNMPGQGIIDRCDRAIARWLVNVRDRFNARAQIKLREHARRVAEREVLGAIDRADPIGLECADRTFRLAGLCERRKVREAISGAETVWIFYFEADDLCSTSKLERLGCVM